MPDAITTGPQSVIVNCPECDEVVLVRLTLSAMLQVDQDRAVIKLRAPSKPVPHTCNDGKVDLFTESDE